MSPISNEVHRIQARITFKSVPISDFLYFQVDFFVDSKEVEDVFMPKYSQQDYAVFEGQKVIGYVICGYYFNFSYIY